MVFQIGHIQPALALAVHFRIKLPRLRWVTQDGPTSSSIMTMFCGSVSIVALYSKNDSVAMFSGPHNSPVAIEKETSSMVIPSAYERLTSDME